LKWRAGILAVRQKIPHDLLRLLQSIAPPILDSFSKIPRGVPDRHREIAPASKRAIPETTRSMAVNLSATQEFFIAVFPPYHHAIVANSFPPNPQANKSVESNGRGVLYFRFHGSY
jgi:hypothetical protein